MTKTVLSERLVRSRAALVEKSLIDVNNDAGFPEGSGYIYRLFGRDNIQLRQINRIANAIDCTACDIMETVEEPSA